MIDNHNHHHLHYVCIHVPITYYYSYPSYCALDWSTTISRNKDARNDKNISIPMFLYQWYIYNYYYYVTVRYSTTVHLFLHTKLLLLLLLQPQLKNKAPFSPSYELTLDSNTRAKDHCDVYGYQKIKVTYAMEGRDEKTAVEDRS